MVQALFLLNFINNWLISRVKIFGAVWNSKIFPPKPALMKPTSEVEGHNWGPSGINNRENNAKYLSFGMDLFSA